MSSTQYMWLNGMLFQAVWFTCILGSTISASLATMGFIGLHFYLKQNASKELLLILKAALLGFSMDMLFSLTGFIQFQRNGEIPYYLLCLWLSFATTIKHSSSKLFSSDLLAIISGILAPCSYFAAQNLGKVSYSSPLFKGIILHALLWAGMMLFFRTFFFKKEISKNAR